MIPGNRKGYTPWNKKSWPRLCNDCGKKQAISVKRPYCKECRNARERKGYNYEKDRARHLKYWYGITQEEYDAMVIGQHHQCAICGNDLRKEKKTHVDHDHKTGKVRSILCVRCNLSIGLLENESWIIKAMAYLKKHGK